MPLRVVCIPSQTSLDGPNLFYLRMGTIRERSALGTGFFVLSFLSSGAPSDTDTCRPWTWYHSLFEFISVLVLLLDFFKRPFFLPLGVLYSFWTVQSFHLLFHRLVFDLLGIYLSPLMECRILSSTMMVLGQ